MFKKIITTPDEELIKVYDDTPLWSAPFGMTLLDTIKYRKNINILDIGSGCGFPMLDVAMRFGNTCKVYGIEIWESGVNKIREKISVLKLSNAEIIHANAEKPPFENEYFGLIISNNGLNNVEDAEKVLTECYRILKPGGQFVFTFNLPDTMFEFYDIFKEVLKENNLAKELNDVDVHISKKRKTQIEMFDLLCKHKFIVNSSLCYSFGYKFTDADSMFNYFTIKEFFLPVWLETLKEEDRKNIFIEVSKRLNRKYDTITLTIPYTCFDCEK
jgi:ubiquinone/menaquinone biosynthesis C-methylase UbiE